MSNRWPKQVPVLFEQDIHKGSFDGPQGDHCLLGWSKEVFEDQSIREEFNTDMQNEIRHRIGFKKKLTFVGIYIGACVAIPLLLMFDKEFRKEFREESYKAKLKNEKFSLRKQFTHAVISMFNDYLSPSKKETAEIFNSCARKRGYTQICHTERCGVVARRPGVRPDVEEEYIERPMKDYLFSSTF